MHAFPISHISPRPRCRTKDGTSTCMMPVFSVVSIAWTSTIIPPLVIVLVHGLPRRIRQSKLRLNTYDSTHLLCDSKNTPRFTTDLSLRLHRDLFTNIRCRPLPSPRLERTNAEVGIMDRCPFKGMVDSHRSRRTPDWRMLNGWCTPISLGSVDFL
jgi:hypothetical protein